MLRSLSIEPVATPVPWLLRNPSYCMLCPVRTRATINELPFGWHHSIVFEEKDLPSHKKLISRQPSVQKHRLTARRRVNGDIEEKVSRETFLGESDRINQDKQRRNPHDAPNEERRDQYYTRRYHPFCLDSVCENRSRRTRQERDQQI